MRSVLHGNIKQGRVTTIACHSHAGQGGGNHTSIVIAKPEDYAMKRSRSKGYVMVWTRPNKQTKKDALNKPRRQHQLGRLYRPKIELQLGMAGLTLTDMFEADTLVI